MHFLRALRKYLVSKKRNCIFTTLKRKTNISTPDMSSSPSTQPPNGGKINLEGATMSQPVATAEDNASSSSGNSYSSNSANSNSTSITTMGPDASDRESSGSEASSRTSSIFSTSTGGSTATDITES
ncbi:hypothetical protein F5Y04DRAFT_275442 [Hypomontagnella monticulosa]|nr:hypothetical protein F5Y04DRAFT_275442 [Hypomontagnella monticulosa]